MGCGSSRTDNNKNIKKPEPTRNNNLINPEVYKNRTSPMPWNAPKELTSAFKAIKDGSQETGESKMKF